MSSRTDFKASKKNPVSPLPKAKQNKQTMKIKLELGRQWMQWSGLDKILSRAIWAALLTVHLFANAYAIAGKNNKTKQFHRA